MEDRKGTVLTNLVSKAIVSKCFCVLPQSDLFYGRNIQLSFLEIFLGRFPAKSLQVWVQSEKTVVDARIGPDLLQLAASLHEADAVTGAADLLLRGHAAERHGFLPSAAFLV